MRVLAVGGGSGGHVIPVAVVLTEIKASHPKAEIRFWTDSKFLEHAKSILKDRGLDIKISTLVSGKLRRYHHLNFFQHLMMPKLLIFNLRDSFLIVIGFLQSLIKLLLWRPDVIFAKGGYVCLPVGIASKWLGIPIVLHDSDAHPGLTNRVLSRWARKIATGAPLEYYRYPAYKAEYVGIPVSADFHKLNISEKLKAKQEWGIKESENLIVITGGGLGAKRINNAVIEILPQLLKLGSVVLVSGTDQYDELKSLTPQGNDRFQLLAFVSSGMASLLGAADVVVTRAGATTILELAALEKPTVLIPNGNLTGGHQLKNAAVYEDAGAVKIINEDAMVENPMVIVDTVSDILKNIEKSKAMASNFSKFARPNAGKRMAELVMGVIK